MESLAYTHAALAYEEAVGLTSIQPLSSPRHLRLKSASSAAAIILAIFFGGFTAVVASAISGSQTTPTHQQSNSF